jgi:hypothetical protein
MNQPTTYIFRSKGIKQIPYNDQIASGTGERGTVIKRHNKCDMKANALYIFNTGYGVELRLITDNRYIQALLHINKHSNWGEKGSINVGGERFNENDLTYLVSMYHAWKPFIHSNML